MGMKTQLLAVITAAAALFALPACQNIPPATQARIGHAAADVGAVAINIGQSWVQNYAADEVEHNAHNDYLHSAAEAVRSTEALHVNGADIYNAVAAATARVNGNTALAQDVARAFTSSQAPPDVTKEAIATGLQTAAMNDGAGVP
jgi:hypothetical protein